VTAYADERAFGVGDPVYVAAGWAPGYGVVAEVDDADDGDAPYRVQLDDDPEGVHWYAAGDLRDPADLDAGEDLEEDADDQDVGAGDGAPDGGRSAAGEGSRAAAVNGWLAANPDVAAAVGLVDVDRVVALPLDQLHPAADNPRGELGDVDKLAASIAAVGLLAPLLVTPRPVGGWTIVAGHRRHAALAHLGRDSAPCLVRDALDEPVRRASMLVENLQRRDLTPLEEARGYQQLADLGLSQRKIAAQVGCTQGHVSKRLALLTLPAGVLARVDAGGITVADAVALAKLRDDPDTVERIAADAWDIAHQVKLALAERDRQATRAATMSSLQADGLRVVDLDEQRDASSLVYHGRPERPIGFGWGHLRVDLDGHTGQDCHAVGVLHGGDLVAVCTDPARHPEAAHLQDLGGGTRLGATTPAGTSEDRSAARRETRERNAEVRAAQARRDETIQRLLAAPVGRDGLEHVARMTVLACRGNSTFQRNKIACQLLGLDVRTDQWGNADLDGTLHAHADLDDDRRLRTALAIALAEGERTPRLWQASDGSSWRGTTTAAHFDYLRRHGHTLTPIEASLLGAAGAPLVDALAELDDDQPGAVTPVTPQAHDDDLDDTAAAAAGEDDR